MRTIHKYDLTVDDLQSIEMPRGADLLHVAEQHERLRLWAYVDPGEPTVRRLIAVHGTGHPVKAMDRGPGGAWYPRYVGTVVGGFFVWHVFDHGEH